MITEYRGFIIEKTEATQVGHQLPGSRSPRQRLGHGTSRSITGVTITYPDGGEKFCDNLKRAKAYIDQWHGDT